MSTWPRSRRSLVLAVALPGLLIGTIGIFHPAHLTDSSAQQWLDLHVVLLPLFPLMALGPWLLARQAGAVAGWAALVLGYVFAMFYTGLDLVAGAAAGALTLAGSAGVNTMYGLGNDLAEVGVWAHLAAAVFVSGLVGARAGARALPGMLLVIAASVSFLDSHIYWPGGVVTMYALALGWAALAAVVPLRESPPARADAA
ncbi:MAG: hypothetical protein M3386_04030 [Actinomycetota bacterium]|nr:hypothetical protein [Actinomycetota bacterium]